MRKLLCYGDSNTFGWDPCDPLGGRYEHPWPSLLQELSGMECVNFGQPGRRIPESYAELGALRHIVQSLAPDAVLILLGTNNRFLPPYDSPKQTAGKMDALLSFLRSAFSPLPLLLIGLPPMEEHKSWVKAVNAEYAALADQYALLCYDPSPLELPLCFDGLHLTEEGHTMLAEGIWKSGIVHTI